MHRFYLPPGECAGMTLCLKEREAHHALHVLRVRRGERVTVLDGAGGQYSCEVQDSARDSVALAVIEKTASPPPAYRITLLQALPKGKIIESIIQRAAELGVFEIVPLISERVTARVDDENAAGKLQKWRLVAIEAIKQCGSPWLPQVQAPVTPAEYMSRKAPCELPLLASLQDERSHPRRYFDEFRARHGRAPRSVCVWVGPEGDFSPAEVNAIRASGALPITLGSLVLRCETAAIYCLSILNYELQADGG